MHLEGLDGAECAGVWLDESRHFALTRAFNITTQRLPTTSVTNDFKGNVNLSPIQMDTANIMYYFYIISTSKSKQIITESK